MPAAADRLPMLLSRIASGVAVALVLTGCASHTSKPV
jgi:hypothetical protein